MKKLIPYITTVASVVLSVFCLLQISNIKDDIRRMENDFNNQLSMMRSQQNAMLSHVDERLQAHASILTRKEFTYGEMDLDKKTVELQVTIIPKEHQPGVTEARLVAGDKEYPMELEDGSYVGSIDLPIFEESAVKQVVFREGETVRTETLDWWFTPRYELLPTVNARISGSARGSAQNGVYVWHHTGEARVQVDCDGEILDIQSVSLLEVLDGVEVNRIEIPLTNTESTRHDGSAAKPEPIRPGVTINNGETFYYELDKDFTIPFGSTMRVLAEVVDGNGLRYLACMEHWEIDANGNQVDNRNWSLISLLEWIISPDGEVLFELDESHYQ